MRALQMLMECALGLKNEAIFYPVKRAIDRLESQEREIVELVEGRSRMVNATAELTMKVGELTARLESAEAERDAAKKRATRFRNIAREQKDGAE